MEPVSLTGIISIRRARKCFLKLQGNSGNDRDGNRLSARPLAVLLDGLDRRAEAALGQHPALVRQPADH